KALAKKPEQRYQTAEEMIAALDEVQATLEGHTHDRTVTRLMSPDAGTPHTGALATLSDIFKRPRLSIGYVAAGLVLIGIVGVFAWMLLRPKLHKPAASAQSLYDRGVDAIREGAFFRASKAFQQAIVEDPQFALAYARLAEAQNELDSPDQAMAELLRAKDLIPDPLVLPRADSLKLQAVTHTVEREFARAGADYTELTSALPAHDKPYALG